MLVAVSVGQFSSHDSVVDVVIDRLALVLCEWSYGGYVVDVDMGRSCVLKWEYPYIIRIPKSRYA